MKIVIAGAGEMGSHLARMLSGNGHDITIIDADQKLLAEVGSLADVLTVEGDSTNLRGAAGALRCADATFSSPSITRRRTISWRRRWPSGSGRRSPSPASTTTSTSNRTTRSCSSTWARLPVLSREGGAAREVINLLGHTSTTEYVDFSSGKLSLAVFRLEPASPLVGEGAVGVRRGAGGAELPHRGHHARRRDDHSASGRTLPGGRRDLRHRAAGRRARRDGALPVGRISTCAT